MSPCSNMFRVSLLGWFLGMTYIFRPTRSTAWARRPLRMLPNKVGPREVWRGRCDPFLVNMGSAEVGQDMDGKHMSAHMHIN